MRDEPLRICKQCHQPLPEGTDVGLRNYAAHLNKYLPGKVGFTDLDAVIDARGKELLVLEFKWRGEEVPMGQKLLLQALALWGHCALVAFEEEGSDDIRVCQVHRTTGKLQAAVKMTKDDLARAVADWRAKALRDESGDWTIRKWVLAQRKKT